MSKRDDMTPENADRLDRLFAIPVMDRLDEARDCGVLNDWEYKFISSMKSTWGGRGKKFSVRQEILLHELAIKLLMWSDTGRSLLEASRWGFDAYADYYDDNHSDGGPPDYEPPEDGPERYERT